MEKTEHRIQSDCFVFFHNTYPEHRGKLAYNHANSRNAIDGAKNKALGLIKGRSDFSFYFNKTAYFLECKTPTGKQSKEQKEWQKLMEDSGFEYFLFTSVDEFKEIIKNIIRPEFP